MEHLRRLVIVKSIVRTLQLQLLTKKSILPFDAKRSCKDLWDSVTKQLVAAIQEGYTVEGYRLKKKV